MLWRPAGGVDGKILVISRVLQRNPLTDLFFYLCSFLFLSDSFPVHLSLFPSPFAPVFFLSCLISLRLSRVFSLFSHLAFQQGFFSHFPALYPFSGLFSPTLIPPLSFFQFISFNRFFCLLFPYAYLSLSFIPGYSFP
jgi:hypothetical protein